MTENVLQEAEFPKTRIQGIKEHLVFQPNWAWAFVCCFLILALRNDLHEVFYPILYNEDGRQIFAHLYNDHVLKSIFYFYAGYIQVFPNLVAYLLHFLPLSIIPSLYALVALIFTAFVYSLFYRVLEHVFDNRGFAFYATLLIIALPQSNSVFSGTLMYQIWHCVIALFVLTFLPLPEKPWLRTSCLVFMHILIWTHPFALLTLPVYLYRVFRQPEHRWENGIFILSILSYFTFAVIHLPVHWHSLPFYPYTLMTRVVTEVVVGPYNRGWFIYMGLSNIFGFTVFLLTGIIIWLARKELKSREKWFLIILSYFILVPLAVSVLGRDLNVYYHLLGGSPRYTYISRLAFSMLGLSALFLLYQRSQFFRKAHWALMVLVLWINSNSLPLYHTSVKQGKEILDYIAYIDENRLDCSEGIEKIYYLRRGHWQFPGTPGDWSIPANLCRH